MCLSFLQCVQDSLFSAYRKHFSISCKHYSCDLYIVGSVDGQREIILSPRPEIPGKDSLTYFSHAHLWITFFNWMSRSRLVRKCRVIRVCTEIIPIRKGWCWAVGPMVLNFTIKYRLYRGYTEGNSPYIALLWYLNWERKYN